MEVLTTPSAESTLLELEDSERLDVLLVEMAVLVTLSALSSDDELPES
jgi:hypothetical protein